MVYSPKGVHPWEPDLWRHRERTYFRVVRIDDDASDPAIDAELLVELDRAYAEFESRIGTCLEQVNRVIFLVQQSTRRFQTVTHGTRDEARDRPDDLPPKENRVD